jgi:hypothetical protein
MAASWSSDSEETLQTLGRAYGPKTPAPEEIAVRKPTIIKFDKQELDSLQTTLIARRTAFDPSKV